MPQWVQYQCSDRHGIHHRALVRTNDGVIHIMKHLLIPVISMYGIFTCKYQVHLVDFYGINVGKYTSPMMGSYGIYKASALNLGHLQGGPPTILGSIGAP